MSTLTNMFVDLTLHDTIRITPKQLGNELYLHLKRTLKEKVEKKCINAGYVCKVKDIISDYKYGNLLPEDFNADTFIKISYHAELCVPIVNSQIVCKITQFITSAIFACNGPVIITIQHSTINTNMFSIGNKGIVHKKTGKILNINDHIKITIKSKRQYIGDTIIGIIGYLDDIATQNEIDNNMFKQYDDDDDGMSPQNNTHVVMNEDMGVDDDQQTKTVLEL